MRIIFVGQRESPHVMRPFRQLLNAGHTVLLFDTYTEVYKGETPDYRLVAAPEDLNQIPKCLQAIARGFKPDIIHVHWVDHIAQKCIDANVAPVVLSVWGSDINRVVDIDDKSLACFKLGYNPNTAMPLMDCLPRAAAIVVDDFAMIKKCRFLAGERVPIYFSHLGVDSFYFNLIDPQQREEGRKSIGISETDKLILSPRAFLGHYGHEAILDAFAQIKKDNTFLAFKLYRGVFSKPTNQKFTTNASWKNLNKIEQNLQSFEELIRDKIHKHGLEENVLFLDFVESEDVPLLYSMSDVLVNFPVQDGFPITFAEAATTGTRVVTPLLAAYEGTFVEDCFDIVESYSVKSLADSIEKSLCTTYDKELKALARREVLAKYSLAKYVDNMLSIYQTILAANQFLKPKPVDNKFKFSVVIVDQGSNNTLGCLHSLINQTFTEWEAIVVCCKDNTEIAKIKKELPDLRIHFLPVSTHTSKEEMQNIAVNKSVGAYLVFLSPDDELDSKYLQSCLNSFESPTNPDLVYTYSSVLGVPSDIEEWENNEVSSLVTKNWLPAIGYAMRKDTYVKAGGHNLDSTLGASVDWDFWISCLRRKFNIKRIDEPLYFCRTKKTKLANESGYVARESMLRHHASLFHYCGLQDQFIKEGFYSEAVEAWKNGKVVKSAILAAKVYQFDPYTLPALPQLSIDNAVLQKMRMQLCITLEAMGNKSLEINSEALKDRSELIYIYISQKNFSLAIYHLHILIALLMKAKDVDALLSYAILLSTVCVHINDMDQAEEVLNFIHEFSANESVAEELRVYCALQKKQFDKASLVALQFMDATEASYDAIRILGLLFNQLLLEKDAKIIGFVQRPHSLEKLEKNSNSADLWDRLYETDFGRKMYWKSRSKEILDLYGNTDNGIVAVGKTIERGFANNVLEIECGDGRALVSLDSNENLK